MFSTNLIPLPAGRTIRDCITVMTGASARTWTLALSTAFAVFVRASESSAAPLDYCYSSQTVSPGAAGARPISDALAKACSNGTINVNPGTYTETLGITKNVTIKAVNPGLPPVIKNLVVQPAPLALVTVSGAATVTLANLKLTPVAIRGVLGVQNGNGAPTVAINGTQVTGGTTGVAGVFHKLTASASSFAAASVDCVAVRSDLLGSSSLNIANSTVGTCGRHGLSSSDFGSATIKDNHVSWTGGNGIASTNTWTAIVHNDVYRGSNGIFVSQASFGAVEDNVVSYSTYGDFVFWESADLFVADNQSLNAKDTGMYIEECTGFTLEYNQITGPLGPGIYINDSADVALAYNSVHGGRPGVYVSDSDSVSMDSDVIVNGERAGIELHNAANFTADYVDIAGVDPDLNDDYGDGILVDHTNVATFTNCNVEDVARAGYSAFNTLAGAPALTKVVILGGSVACAAILFDEEHAADYAPSGVSCRDCSDHSIVCESVSKGLEEPEPMAPLAPPN